MENFWVQALVVALCLAAIGGVYALVRCWKKPSGKGVPLQDVLRMNRIAGLDERDWLFLSRPSLEHCQWAIEQVSMAPGPYTSYLLDLVKRYATCGSLPPMVAREGEEYKRLHACVQQWRIFIKEGQFHEGLAEAQSRLLRVEIHGK